MNWDDLKFALAVGRAGTLSGAARALRVNATTVGRRIAAIEENLGARLFDRTAGGLRPTDAGHRALAHAEDIERSTISLSRQIEGQDSRVEGCVRLTGLDAIFDHLIIPLLPRLLSRHPGVEVTFASGVEIVDLSRREADIALRDFKPSHPDAVSKKLGTVAMAVYASKNLAVGENPPLIALPRESDWTDFSHILPGLFPRSFVTARGNTEGHLLSLTRAGTGIAVLDCYLGDSDPQLYRVVEEPVSSRMLCAEAHVEMASAPRIRAVFDFLGEIFIEHADLLAGRKPQPRI